MAGDLRILNKEGRVIDGPIAMGLTTNVSGVDFDGKNIIATDASRLYWLWYQSGSLYSLKPSVNLSSQVSNGRAIVAMCCDESGIWIAMGKSTLVINIERFDLKGNYLFTLPNFSISTSDSVYDMTYDGKYIYISYQPPALPLSQSVVKMYANDGTSIVTTQQTSSTLKYTGFCWNGQSFYAMKQSDDSLAVYGLDHVERATFGITPGVSTHHLGFMKNDNVDAILDGLSEYETACIESGGVILHAS